MLIFWLLAWAGLAQAQSASGGLRGSIQDADFFMPVSGVQIMLEGTSVSAATDADGRFFLNDVPPGEYALLARKSGYISGRRSSVVVTAGSVREVSLDLTAEVVELDEFMVEAALEEELSTTPLSLGASLQSFASTVGVEALKAAGSSGDIGNLTKRLASTAVVDSRYVVIRGLSDRYNVVVLNGARIPSSDPDKRAVNIDIFPTGLVENLVSSKTFVSSMPGETTGGYLNIITKRVPEKPFFKWSTSSAFNTGATGRDGFLTDTSASTGFLGTANERALPENVRAMDATSLPAANPTTGPFAGTNTTSSTVTTQLTGPTAGTVTFTNAQNIPFQTNRRVAAEALAGRATGVGTMEAPLNFSFSALGGTRVEDFMGGTLGIVGGVTYSKRYQTDAGVRGAARIINRTTGEAQQTLIQDYQRGQESLLAGALLSAALEFSSYSTISLTYFANVAAEDEATFAIGETLNLPNFPSADGIPGEEVLVRESLLYTERRLQTLQLAGEHVFPSHGDVKMDWVIAYSMSSQDQPDIRRALYSYNYVANTYANSGEPAPPDFERVWRKLEDTNYNMALNFEIPLEEYQDEQRPRAVVKIGGSTDYSTRKYSAENFEYNVPQASYMNNTQFVPRLSNPITADNTTVADTIGVNDPTDSATTSILLGPPANRRQNVTTTDRLFLVRGDNLPVTETYEATQSINAAHASITFSMKDNLEVFLGARVESTDMRIRTGTDLANLGVTSNSGQLLLADPITGRLLDPEKLANPTIVRTDLLPAIGVRWEIAEHHLLRSSITRTVARPTFKEIAPAISRDPESGDFFVGWVELEMSSIVNYDLRWEWDRGGGDLVAVSAFAKSISKPIENVYTGLFNTVRNDQSATLYGFEIELNQRLGEIMPPLEGLNFSMNYGYVFSQVQLNADNQRLRSAAGLPLDRPLQGQPEYTFNAALSHDNKDLGISAGILLNITGPLLYAVGGRAESINLDAPDVYQRAFTSVDAYLTKTLFKNWELNFRISNLLDSPRQRYFTGGIPYSDVRTGTVYSLGLSAKW